MARIASFQLFVMMLAVLAVFAADTPAFAQPPPGQNRPYRGLFGGGTSGWDQSLTLNGYIGSGMDKQVLKGDLGDGTFGTEDRLGAVGDGYLGLNYNLTRESYGINALAGLTGRYYPGIGDPFSAAVNTHADAWLALWGGTLRVSILNFVRPLDSVTVIPVPPVAGTVEPTLVPSMTSLGVSQHAQRTAGYGLSLSHPVSRRVSVHGGFNADLSSYADGSSQWSWSGSGGVSYGIRRDLSLRVTYTHHEMGYPSTPDSASERNAGRSLDVGLHFNRTLSLNRRTSLSFSSGTLAVTNGQQTSYELTGHVTVHREIGRSWNADFSYYRDIDFLGSVETPVFSNSLSAALHGLIARRLAFQALVAVGGGNAGIIQVMDTFNGYTGAANLTYGLTRHLGVGVSYWYYGHAFDNGAVLVPGMLAQVSRHSVIASLNLWTPILHTTRRANATR
jgi:hypothetical protein